jgi:hypothetical protein
MSLSLARADPFVELLIQTMGPRTLKSEVTLIGCCDMTLVARKVYRHDASGPG